MNVRKPHPYAGIKAIIFDVDNTLYPQTPELLGQAKLAFCKAVRTDMGAVCNVMTDEQVIARGMESLASTGDAFRCLSAMGGDAQKIHALMHRLWPEDLIEPNPALAASLKSLRAGGIKLYAYSDAYYDWTHRALGRRGIADCFEEGGILTRDALPGFPIKRDSDDGFNHLQRLSGLEMQQMLMVDDGIENLARAKSLGMKTVLIGNKDLTPVQKGAVDFQYSDVEQFLADFEQARQPQGFTQRPRASASASRV